MEFNVDSHSWKSLQGKDAHVGHLPSNHPFVDASAEEARRRGNAINATVPYDSLLVAADLELVS